MVESAFLINSFKWLASVLVKKVEGDLVGEISDSVHDKIKKAQIEQTLNEKFERYFNEQYESLSIFEEFNVRRLNEWLLDNLYTKVIKCFVIDGLQEKDRYKNSFMKSAYARAEANTEIKIKGVKAYVESFLNAFEYYYFILHENELDQYLLLKQTEDIRIILHNERKELEESINQHDSFAEFIDSIIRSEEHTSELQSQ
mgnify:FL=1